MFVPISTFLELLLVNLFSSLVFFLHWTRASVSAQTQSIRLVRESFLSSLFCLFVFFCVFTQPVSISCDTHSHTWARHYSATVDFFYVTPDVYHKFGTVSKKTQTKIKFMNLWNLISVSLIFCAHISKSKHLLDCVISHWTDLANMNVLNWKLIAIWWTLSLILIRG